MEQREYIRQVLEAYRSTPGTAGANGSRYFALYVVDMEPKVRPWKL